MPKGTRGRATCSVDDCDGFCISHGWCKQHHRIWQNHGDPLYQRPGPEERYWVKVDQRGLDDCWLWTGATMRDGYGSFGVSHGDIRRAHRYGWELAYGPIPDGLIVCHRCDTPLCQNPAHLFLGNPQANTRDMMSKGRARFGRGKGAARDTNGRYV